MSKWSHLIEASDKAVRDAERAWKSKGDDESLVHYVNTLRRSGAEVPSELADRLREIERRDADLAVVNRAHPFLRRRPPRKDKRWNRIRQAFKDNPTRETAEELMNDYDRVKSAARDYEISRHCNLRGKMGSVCHQANQTEITTRDFVILVSYRTPVAYRVRSTGEWYVTDTKHSVTTTGHISRWAGWPNTTVPQAEIDEIYKAI